MRRAAQDPFLRLELFVLAEVHVQILTHVLLLTVVVNK